MEIHLTTTECYLPYGITVLPSTRHKQTHPVYWPALFSSCVQLVKNWLTLVFAVHLQVYKINCSFGFFSVHFSVLTVCCLMNMHSVRAFQFTVYWIGPMNCQPKWLRTRSAEIWHEEKFFHCWSYHIGTWIVFESRKPSPNHQSWFYENRTPEIEFSVFEFWGQFGSVFRNQCPTFSSGFTHPCCLVTAGAKLWLLQLRDWCRYVTVRTTCVVKASSTLAVNQFLVQSVVMRLRRRKTSACQVSTVYWTFNCRLLATFITVI